MSVSNPTGEKLWNPGTSAFGHRRRNSSSCLFNTSGLLSNTQTYNSNRYLALAKLHSDSSGVGLNSLRLPVLPRGALFRSSLPATPLSTPMYTSIFSHFTEQDIRNLLDNKSSTPKVLKSMSHHDFASAVAVGTSSGAVPANGSADALAAATAAATVASNATNSLGFDDESHRSTSIVTRATVPASYKIDSKSAKELAEQHSSSRPTPQSVPPPAHEQIVEEDEEEVEATEAEETNSSEPVGSTHNDGNNSLYLSAEDQDKRSESSPPPSVASASIETVGTPDRPDPTSGDCEPSNGLKSNDEEEHSSDHSSKATKVSQSSNASTNKYKRSGHDNRNNQASVQNEIYVAGFDIKVCQATYFKRITHI